MLNKNFVLRLMAVAVLASLVLSACAQATPVPTTEPMATEAPPAIGSAEHPIKVLFVPSVDVDFMVESGDLIEQALSEATGLVFEVSVPTSYAATIEEMCASPTDTMGFIPGLGYALASNQIGRASCRERV